MLRKLKHRKVAWIVLGVVCGCALIPAGIFWSWCRAGHFCDSIDIGMSEGQVDTKLPWFSSKKVVDVKDTFWTKNIAEIPTNGYVVQYWVWHSQPVEVVFTSNHTVDIALSAFE
jgi:hypothetical protein